MEILKEIHRNDWPELRDLYRNNWPKNAVAYRLLDNHISCPNLSETFNFKVYCPHGDLNNGMVAILDKYVHRIMIQPVNNIEKIEQALSNTKIINWDIFLHITAATPEIEDCLRRLKHVSGRIKSEKAFKHILNRNTPKFDNISLPPNTYVTHIKPEHIKFIDEKWTYHGKNTYKFFKALMKNELTYALYSTEEFPLAWVVIDANGLLTHLYCVESHRRKGYAEFLLQYVINDQLSKGKDILAYTSENNLKPKRLFDKLNFEKPGYDKWLFIY